MATTTSYCRKDSSSKLNNRRANIGWRAPGDLRPKSLISSEYGPALRDDELISLARAVSSLDRHLLELVELLFKEILNGRLNQGDVAAQVQARHDIADIATLELQFYQIAKGQNSFSELYLEDRHMLYYWQVSFSLICQILDVGSNDSLYTRTLNYMETAVNKASVLEVLLVDAASKGLLRSEVRSVFGERWDKLDQACEVYYQHTQSSRTLANWYGLSHKIQEAMKKPAAQQNLSALPSQFWTITTTLWLTFAGTALSNVWTFALAYYYSIHKPGTTKDADFWFLLQGCITQGFGLATSCLPLLKKSHLPKWSWMPPMVLALICTMLAPPLYVTLPTEWSSFLALIATAVQAFIVLQLALIGE